MVKYRTLKKLVLFNLFLLYALDAPALDTLPYTFRRNPYNGWSTTNRGDIRTVGMSGATVGLSDTFISALDNPAGLAMTLNGGDWNFAQNITFDGAVQNYDSATYTRNFGIAFNAYPWGLSVGYISPYNEGQQYLLPGQPNLYGLDVTTRELHLSLARIFFNNHVSFGGSLILGQGTEQIVQEFSQANYTLHSYAVGAVLGTTFKLPHHLLLGASYSLPMHYSVNSQVNQPSVLPGFFQSIQVPGRLGIGLGWIPNANFRADFTTFVIGSNSGASLIRNDNVEVGRSLTLQPKIGLAYSFMTYKELKGTLFLGSYYETTRIQDAVNRFHQTGGFEIKPWIFNIGAGIDNGREYRNYLVSIGIDVFYAMAKLDIIPGTSRTSNPGLLPPPLRVSDVDLPRPLVKDWHSQGPGIDPIEIGISIPMKLERKAEEFGNAVKELFIPTAQSSQASPPVRSQPPAKKVHPHQSYKKKIRTSARTKTKLKVRH